MKKILLALAVLVLATVCISCGASNSEGVQTLYVYNWGEYISDGSEHSLVFLHTRVTLEASLDWNVFLD